MINSDRNVAIAEFRQTHALEGAMNGELEWPLAMSIVRDTYQEGAAKGLRRVFMTGRMIPDTIANEVLFANPAQYPVALWDVAEGVASAKARKAIKAVGPIAKAEKWFAT